MAIRHAPRRGLLGSDSLGAAAAALVAALVTRAALPAVAGAIGPTLLVAAGACAALEVAAALVRARVAAREAPGPLARSRAAALARLGVALAATMVASALSAGGGSERAACFSALLFVLLALPAAPMAGGRLLEALLARRSPQLVAARLAGRLGFTAALAGPGALLLLPGVRADDASLAALPALALLLIGGVRRARDDAFARELALQARRDESGLSEELRAELLATPLDPDVATLRPLSAEQFLAFRAELERGARD